MSSFARREVPSLEAANTTVRVSRRGSLHISTRGRDKGIGGPATYYGMSPAKPVTQFQPTMYDKEIKNQEASLHHQVASALGHRAESTISPSKIGKYGHSTSRLKAQRSLASIDVVQKGNAYTFRHKSKVDSSPTAPFMTSFLSSPAKPTPSSMSVEKARRIARGLSGVGRSLESQSEAFPADKVRASKNIEALTSALSVANRLASRSSPSPSFRQDNNDEPTDSEPAQNGAITESKSRATKSIESLTTALSAANRLVSKSLSSSAASSRPNSGDKPTDSEPVQKGPLTENNAHAPKSIEALTSALFVANRLVSRLSPSRRETTGDQTAASSFNKTVTQPLTDVEAGRSSVAADGDSGKPKDVRDKSVSVLAETEAATAAFLEPMQLSGSERLIGQIQQTIDPIIAEHRRLFAYVTRGTQVTVVRTPTDDEIPRTSAPQAANMYITPDLKSLVLSGVSSSAEAGAGWGTFCVPLSEITGLVCLEAYHVLPEFKYYPYVSRSSPVMRVMIRSTVTHWDCIVRDLEERNNWLAGVSLAYGLQTVPVISSAEH